MDIVFNIDNGYVRHMCVTMLSILDSNRDDNICFHVISFDLTEENKKYVNSLAHQHGGNVMFYDINVYKLKSFPIGQNTANPGLSYATYLRLFIPDILPNTINKVLFLDCDIVVINSLKPLWNTDLTDYALAAVDDYGLAQENGARRMKLEQGYTYFNAGVLLINVNKLREMNFFNKVVLFVKKNMNIIKLHDQDILNGMLYKQRLVLDEKWDLMACNHLNEDSVIIHFAGIKPWHKECFHPLKNIYYKYLDQTKWAGTPPTHYKSRWQRFKSIIKMLIRK